MRLVINHLTRMVLPHICVAGLLEDGTAHVRPIAGHLSRDLAASHGGPFDIGALVDIGSVERTPTKPETEDHRFDPEKVRRVEYVPTKALWQLFRDASNDTLEEIFGPDLRVVSTRRGTAAAVAQGQGLRSLGLLRPSARLTVQVEDSYDGRKQELRATLTDKLGELNLSVTDLRFYDENYAVKENLVKKVQSLLEREEDVLLSVGLTRAFARPGDAPRHWLQVNNIHVSSDPAGRDW